MKQGWHKNIYERLTHYVDDVIHSIDDNPAMISTDGEIRWYKNLLIHRDQGKPAIIRSDGCLEFFENGKELKKCSCGLFAKKYCPTRKINK